MESRSENVNLYFFNLPIYRFLELKAAIIPTLAIRQLDVQITKSDWDLMEKVNADIKQKF